MQRVIDRLAIVLSAICVVHCLAVPIVLLAMPGVLAGDDHGDLTHMIIFAIALPLSTLGMWYGYQTHHKARYALCALFGILGLAAGLTLHGMVYEVYVTIFASLILALAHLGNRNATRLTRTAG